MSHTTTTELSLRKDGADEAIVNFRGVTNDNLDIIDSAYGQSLDNVASVEGSTASTNHAVGTYLIQNGILYKVTSAITSGENIVSGTNVIQISISDIILALNDSIQALENLTGKYTTNNAYRGKSLGSGTSFANASTSEQRAAISNGTFSGLFVGDYWTINSTVYRIADSDYWYRSGDTDTNVHHLVIVPDKNWGNASMNSTNITTGAYCGSNMYTSSSSPLGTARSTIASDFGGYLLNHKEYLPKTVDSTGAQSEGQWVSSTVELMNELMVYGCFIHAKPTTSNQHLYTIDKAQLALFRLNPGMVNLRYNYWLRDVVSSANFARVLSLGVAGNNAASGSNGVRLAFGIKGTT